jgi:glycosyltransferase involved in cell wall biosynthesis
MKIDMLAVSGSPLHQTLASLWGKDGVVGIGGSEQYMLTLCEEWHKRGHQVRLYNDPRQQGVGPFEQCNINQFNPAEYRDALIGFRVLDWRFQQANAGKKIWLSCDQYATGDFKEFSKWASKVVCISPFHQKYFADTYDIFDTVSIDIPVRVQDYDAVDVEKVVNRCIFTSVPGRGLDVLAVAWPEIVKQVPDASLVITSDYRLWNQPEALNEEFKAQFASLPNVQFLGAITRDRLIAEQKKAQILTFPCVYNELFCIAVSEAQYAGCFPITSDMGALATTNQGEVIPGNPKHFPWIARFVDRVVYLLQHPAELEGLQEGVKNAAEQLFSPDVIMPQWEKLLE